MGRSIRIFLAGTVLPVLTWGQLSYAQMGQLSVTVTDTEGKRTPCFIALEDRATGNAFPLPQPHFQALSGKTTARFQWDGQHPVHCDGQITLPLPEGDWRVSVGKGIEYIPAVIEVNVAGGEETNVSVTLERHIDMPTRGWWSGDCHVHIERPDPSIDAHILMAAQAEDIHVTNTLTWGDVEAVHAPQYAFGQAGSVRDGDYWLIPGQEEPRTSLLGHTIMLNIPEFVRDQKHYYLYDRVFKRVRESGGLVGYAHYFGTHFPSRGQVYDFLGKPIDFKTWDGNWRVSTKFNGDNGASLDLVDGLVDFLEGLDDNNVLRPEPYYDALNLGFRVPLSAGSDFPWGAHIGDQRVYVFLGENRPLTPQAWYEGIRAGRTFITQGPLLDLNVDGEGIGSELHVSKYTELRINADAWGHPAVGAPKDLALVVMGDDIDTARSMDETMSELSLSHTLRVEHSLWIAARVTAHNGAKGQTSPIYVIVDDEPTVARSKVDDLVAARLRRLTKTRELVEKSIEEGYSMWTRLQPLFLKRVEKAERFYKEMRSRGD